MAKSGTAVDEQSTGEERPVSAGRRRWAGAAKVAAAVLVGGALFAGGMVVANQVGGSDSDLVDEAADLVVLRQMGLLSQQADAIIAQVQAADPTDLETQQALGVELQTVAVALDGLPAQATDPELREICQIVSDGYLDLSVGLVTNSAAKTSSGADGLSAGRERLEAYLGEEVQRQEAPAHE